MSNQAQVLHLHYNPISELIQIRKEMKDLQEKEDNLKVTINLMLNQNHIDEMVIGQDKVVRTNTERNTFDSKAFRAKHPELYNQYKKTSVITTLKTL